MLPKVATHLLHSTVTRSAAAAVQNQSSLRNVLQKQHPSGSTPGSSASASTFAGSSTTTNTTFTSNQHLASSSAAAAAAAAAAGVGAGSTSVNGGFFTSNATGKSRAISTEEAKANAHGGSHGPGSGQGSKKNKAGSRFYTGYNGAARAVTQANTLTSQDGSSQADESTAGDESMHPAARRALLKKKNIAVGASATPKRTRLRSSSVNSLLPRKDATAPSSESTVSVGSVLKTVQLQARSLHALAAAQQQQQVTQEPTEEAISSIEVEAETATAEVVQDLATAPEPPVAAQEARVASRSASPVRPISPRPRRNSTSSHVSLPSSPIIHPTEIPLPASPLLLSVRHNSTVAGSAPEVTPAVEEVPVAPEAPSPAPSLRAASPRPRTPKQRTPTPPPSIEAAAEASEPHVARPTTPRPAPKKNSSFTQYGADILAAFESNDPSAIFTAVHALHTAPPSSPPSIPDFNIAIEVLGKIRPEGQPIKRILDVYASMVRRGCRPNLKTYVLLLGNFTDRDRDAVMFKNILAARGALLTPEERSDVEEQIRKVEEEGNLGGAMKVFEAIVGVEGGNERLEGWVYKRLLRSSGMYGNVGVALRVLSMVEQRGWVKEPDHFKYLIQAFANSGDFKGAELVFEKYRKAEESGMLNWPVAFMKRVEVWNEMVGVYFRKGEPEKAIEVLELMLKTPYPASRNSKDGVVAASSTTTTDTAEPTVATESEDLQTTSAEGSEPSTEGFKVPNPMKSTFTAIITGFINHSQDLSSALLWFNRLLAEPDAGMKPDAQVGAVLLNALAESGRVDELNQLYESLIAAQERVDPAYKGLVFSTNLRSALDQETEKEVALGRVAFVRRQLESELINGPWVRHNQRVVYDVCEAYVVLGVPHEATAFLRTVVNGALEQQRQQQLQHPPTAEEQQVYPDVMDVGVVEALQALVGSVTERIVSSPSSAEWAFSDSMDLAKLSSEQLGMRILPLHAAWLVHSFATTRPAADLEMESWRILLSSAVYLESHTPSAAAPPVDGTTTTLTGLASLLESMASANVRFDDELCDEEARVSIVDLVSRGRDVEWCREFFGRLGAGYWESYERVVAQRYSEIEQKLNEAATITSSPPAPSSPTYSYYNQSSRSSNSYHSSSPAPLSPPAPPPPIFAMTSKFGAKLYQNRALAKDVDRLIKDASRPLEARVDEAYNMFQTSFQVKGCIPSVPSLARLIQACGRAGQLDRVTELYAVAMAFVETLKDKHTSAQITGETKTSAWLRVEDSMIVALAQAGDVEGAHVHRRRIVEFANRVNVARSQEGGVVYAPSSDAYGALIYNVKDTTDDATNALMLWNEATELGVEPNLYLYNNIISKLARARKADQALELFKQMKERGLSPSSITYGAMIGACVRVGDVSSAEALFTEMETQRNFKPRVPPFNTMMQLYTTTKPNRERALWFYEEMGRQGVEPTAHTYKLLLDVYGSVEPVDIASMESVFENLKADPSVKINGTHIASLLNAYGCVLKDLDQAIAVFESVPAYDISRDAVIYEALVNALVANKRTDLIRGYIKRMMDDGVHMTAYVANFLIKGYANVGDIEQARVVFESMMDPPMGVAAPNNHAPHEPGVTLGHVGVLEPVYREPSTWEAMVRAELGAGNRDRAVSLLERLKARQYPEAVFNRISGVMVDHSLPLL